MSVFSTVPTAKAPRSTHTMRPVNTMSFNFGGLYPIFTHTVMPGDKMSLSMQSFVRTVPLIAPVMSRNDIKIDAFYVPIRLIWKSAEKWFECDPDVVKPKLYCATQQAYNNVLGPGSLGDYLNFGTPPLSVFEDLEIDYKNRGVDALPFRAYRMIYDFYYRSKTFEKPIEEIGAFLDFYGDSDNIVGLNPSFTTGQELAIQLRPWRRDIFTSALPEPQTGADVIIPQGDIEADGILNLSKSDPGASVEGDLMISANAGTGSGYVLRKGSDPAPNSTLEYNSGLKIGNSPTIRQLRTASALEEYEEAKARVGVAGLGGTFKEWLRGIHSVKSSDARLDRPEYLGGYRGPIQISEVPQTSGSTESSPQGNLAGKGLSFGGSRLFKKHFFEEPGIVMVIMSIVPKTAYCQGDPREWLYESGFDFPNPYFDRIGEQDVKAQELNCLAPFFPDEVQQTFGYNVRYYEMKSYPDEIHGAFRDSLSFWHEGRIWDWDNFPGLNKDFIHVSPEDVSRIFPSTETSDKLLGQFFFKCKVKRNLSYYGVPTLR